MKKLTLLGASLMLASILVFSPDLTQTTKAQSGGHWARADVKDRYPCAGRPVDCYVLPPIIITPDKK